MSEIRSYWFPSLKAAAEEFQRLITAWDLPQMIEDTPDSDCDPMMRMVDTQLLREAIADIIAYAEQAEEQST